MKDPQESLKKWSDQKWRTSDGKPSKGKKRYLPDAAWDKLSQKEKDATNQAKARGNAKGKQFVAQPKAIAKKKVHLMESVAKPILFTAASKILRKMIDSGINVTRSGSSQQERSREAHQNENPMEGEVAARGPRRGEPYRQYDPTRQGFSVLDVRA